MRRVLVRRVCGIFGFLGPRSSQVPDLRAWGASLRHRGPDDRGETVLTAGDSVCAIGQTRLSIIDLSAAGHQPMLSADGRYAIVYNGELYNYRSIREELKALGHRFMSTSDTEVLLAAFIQWREAALPRFRGMFAFAVWDRDTSSLFVARDRLGVKPLYIARTQHGAFVFASEVRAILASELVERRVSRAALSSMLAFGSVYEPFTIVEGVSALRPGTWLEVSARGERRGTYYEIPLPTPSSSPRADVIEELRRTLADAVRLRLEADVPVGVFLSGGIDSAVVATLAARATTSPLHTFTVTFDGADDEGLAAGALARSLGTVHHEAHLTSDGIERDIDRAVAALDQPSADGINTFFVSGAARAAGLRVALSGIGGDELFAGYGTFRKFARAWQMRPGKPLPSGVRAALSEVSCLPHLPVAMRKVMAAASSLGAPGDLYSQFRALFFAGQRQRLLGGKDAEALMDGETVERIRDALARGDLDAINAFGALETSHYLRNTLLRDSDVMSMAHGLEVREPLLDHQLLELAFAIPGSWKLAGHGNKPMLTAAVPEIPMTTREMPKRGFALPFDHWLRGSLRPWMEERLNTIHWASGREVSRLWKSYLRGGTETTWARMWTLAVIADYAARHRLAF